MSKNCGFFAHRIPPGLPKSSQLRFKILSFTFKFQTDNSKIQILFSIFKIPTCRALASKVQGFTIQGFSIQALGNQRIQRIERMGAVAPVQRLVYIYICTQSVTGLYTYMYQYLVSTGGPPMVWYHWGGLCHSYCSGLCHSFMLCFPH